MQEFLKKSEVAGLLRVSLNTLNFWVCKKKIPYWKLGSGKRAGVRFSREEIEKWLRENRGIKDEDYH